MRSVTFQGAPTLEKADDGFQEAGKRKRPRGRPPGFLIAQEEAARSSRQGKLTFARKVDTDLTGDRGDGWGPRGYDPKGRGYLGGGRSGCRNAGSWVGSLQP